MFTEIVHGLMKRTLKDQPDTPEKPTPTTVLPRPDLRIGIIPAGRSFVMDIFTCPIRFY